MGTRGPKPLPNNVHLLNGNPSKKNTRDLMNGCQVPVAVPKAPSHLLPGAKQEWTRITEHLEKLGLVTELDMAHLAAYCQSYARWCQAERELKKLGLDGLVDETPSGYKQISVWLQISNRALEQMSKHAAEFGLSPSARSRVTINPQQDLFGDDSSGASTNPAAQYFRT